MKFGKLILKIIGILIIGITLFYAFLFCTKDEESGIKISGEITVYQNFYTNLKFRNYIKQTLNQDEKGLISILEIPTFGAHSYAMGDILTQIAYKIGDESFLKMVKKLNTEEKILTKALIEVGLMYSYDYSEMEKEFPLLWEYFNSIEE